MYDNTELTWLHIHSLRVMVSVLITGATGFLGGRVLDLALASPAISQVISLQRRPLPATSPHRTNIKLKIILLADETKWTAWPEEVLTEMGNVDACIWSAPGFDLRKTVFNRACDLYRTIGLFRYPDSATFRRVSIDYTLNGLRSLLSHRRQQSKGALRFAYVSGSMTERDINRIIWIKPELRKVRGEVENQLLALADSEGSAKLQITIARPGKILGKPNSWDTVNWIMPTFTGLPMLHVDVLAKALVEAILRGSSKQILENADLVSSL